MLDEQQGRSDRTLALPTDNVSIDKGLQVVVGMLADVLRQEYGIDIGQRLYLLAARLVVYHADGAVVHQVKTVDAATQSEAREVAVDVALQAEDGERCQTAVYLQQLAEVVNDDLAVDEMQAAGRSVWHLFVESLVYGTLYFYLRLQQVVNEFPADVMRQLVVDDVGGFVEDVAEDAVVQFQLVFRQVRLPEPRSIAVVELQGTTHILVDG